MPKADESRGLTPGITDLPAEVERTGSVGESLVIASGMPVGHAEVSQGFRLRLAVVQCVGRGQGA
jgi:hypothetical protein